MIPQDVCAEDPLNHIEMAMNPLNHVVPIPRRVETNATDRYNFGVAFRNLNVYGSSSLDQHQHTAASYILDTPKCLARLFRRRERSKSHILRDFSGLVRSGEMLLVLGRPGSGCSTLLKVSAGETRGLDIDDVSKINYDGEYCFN